MADAVVADRRRQVRSPAVGPVSDQRVAGPRQMDPDLVRSPGIEATAEKGGGRRLSARGGRLETKVGNRPLAATTDDSPFCRMAGVRPDRRVDADPAACAEGDTGPVRQPGVRAGRRAPRKGQVLPFDVMGSEALREGKSGRFLLCHDQQATGTGIKAVHDAGAQRVPDIGERAAAMGQNRMGEGTAMPLVGRMHQHSGCLVDYEEVGILEHDLERNELWLQCRFHRVWHYSESLAGTRDSSRIKRGTRFGIRLDCAVLEKPSKPGAAQSRKNPPFGGGLQGACQCEVEA